MDFPFKFSLIYNDNSIEIQPTSNLYQLKSKAKEHFKLENVNIFYLDENNEENKIKDDNDYINLINSITEENLNEIDLIIKNEKDSKNKKSIIKNKNISFNNNNNQIYDENNDYLVGEENDYFIFGDIRNKKLNENYSKKNRGFKEQKRIYYIKQKKDIQRKEQYLKNFENQKNQEKNFVPIVKNNKRKLKENLNKNEHMFKIMNNLQKVQKKEKK